MAKNKGKAGSTVLPAIKKINAKNQFKIDALKLELTGAFNSRNTEEYIRITKLIEELEN